MSNQIVTPKSDLIQVTEGDIFYASWGYEQTNINFVKVIGFSKSKKMVKIVSIGQKHVEATGPMSEKVAPDPDAVIAGTETYVKIYSKSLHNEAIILRGSYYYCPASKHLGWLYKYESPMYQSHYA